MDHKGYLFSVSFSHDRFVEKGGNLKEIGDWDIGD